MSMDMSFKGGGATFGISVRGEKQLIKDLQNLRTSAANSILRKATSKALTLTVRAAKKNYNRETKNRNLAKMVTKKVGTMKKGGVYGKVFLKVSKSPHDILMPGGRAVPLNVAANILEYGRHDGSLEPRFCMRNALAETEVQVLYLQAKYVKEYFAKYAEKCYSKGKGVALKR